MNFLYLNAAALYQRTAVMQVAEIVFFRKASRSSRPSTTTKMLHVIFSVLKNEGPYTPVFAWHELSTYVHDWR
ncbi:MAG: hypothetical protein CMM47_06165 [Rhodospirillaceae bacterium]|nr:hypothetical protein [Rhodospirillaceae bacterium]